MWHLDVGMSSVFAGGGDGASSSSLSRLPALMAAAPLAGSLAALVICVPSSLRRDVLVSSALAGGGYFVTRALIPVIASKIPPMKRGCDLLKRPPRAAIEPKDRNVPESLGLVSGVALASCLVLEQAFSRSSTSDEYYAAAILCIVFAVLLGFADDFLDLEWRYKYALPPLMSLPLLSAYDGGTRIVPPKFCRAALVGDENTLGSLARLVLSSLFGGDVDSFSGAVDLGAAYKIYMVLLAVFCTNAINIYAGVNGLECGQCYVVACAILAMSAVELGRAAGSDNETATNNHLFSVTLMLPFATTTLALLQSNWFPAKVFVGDTFTNYAGMTLAVVAILGHFPIMLMLLMLPQLANFLLSIPQLFGLRTCPRHRLPTFDQNTGLLRPSKINDRVKITDRDGYNLTLINAVLVVFGPLTEPALATVLLFIQLVTCGLGLALRFSLVGHVY